MLDALAAGPPLDLAIVGGGINGCGIAREAAARGLRVALFEQDDFGFGTTWRSTKLIHGGLRYLEHGDVRLVFESLRERAWLLATRPHLVQPLRFLLPMVPWTRRPRWQLRAGLALYDLLALYRGVPRHRGLSPRALRSKAPWLAPQANGGFAFYDARVSAPERLALELALEARTAGAAIVNHARVAGITVAAGRVEAVEVEHGGQRTTIAAAAVVNAAGPWVDAVNQLLPRSQAPLLGVTRGTHVVFEPNRTLGPDAVFSTAREDGRVFFAVPQGDLLLVGTTDDRYDGDPGDVRPTGDDLAYLLSEARQLLPGLDLDESQVRYLYAGLRPLQRVKGGPEAAISRSHEVIDHGRSGGPAGLFSVVGGKLSTFRPLARQVVDSLDAGSREPVPVPAPAGLPSPVPRLAFYGPSAAAVAVDGMEPLCSHSGAVRGEVVHAVRQEQATTLSDVLMRRSGIAWSSCRGLCCHEEAAALMAPLLAWDAIERERQVDAFESDIRQHLPAVKELEAAAAR